MNKFPAGVSTIYKSWNNADDAIMTLIADFLLPDVRYVLKTQGVRISLPLSEVPSYYQLQFAHHQKQRRTTYQKKKKKKKR